jgi:hypothetical protein
MNQGLSIRSIVSERVAALAVTLSTIAFWLVILTFPTFFFYNPFETEDTVFRMEQIFSTFGWIVTGTLPVLFAWVTQLKGKSTQPLFMVAVAMWPFSILLIQITSAVRGLGFYSYLGAFPVLALTDIIAPLFLLLISSALSNKGSKDTVS